MGNTWEIFLYYDLEIQLLKFACEDQISEMPPEWHTTKGSGTMSYNLFSVNNKDLPTEPLFWIVSLFQEALPCSWFLHLISAPDPHTWLALSAKTDCHHWYYISTTFVDNDNIYWCQKHWHTKLIFCPLWFSMSFGTASVELTECPPISFKLVSEHYNYFCGPTSMIQQV